jgi:suppressor of G2 allele of SKP1
VPSALANAAYLAPDTGVAVPKKKQKNWDGITTQILEKEKEKSTEEDPNVGGDASVNDFFKKLYSGADEDTQRAMLKSYQESGGTALSTNWTEVGKERVAVQPPTGSEWKKWAA